MKTNHSTIATAWCVILSQCAFAATTFHVAPPPLGADTNSGTEAQPFATIQQGVDVAADGDIIVVHPAIYDERIRFQGKSVVLRSADPSDTNVVAQTVIDGGEAGPVVTYEGTEDETARLAGFTIRNGYGSQGGGIAGNGTHATIEHNAIVNNGAYPDGGGLHNCDGTIRNNTIADNWGPEDGAGGGLYGCDGLIEGNLIHGNWMYDGGGLYACHGTIQNNRIIGNFGQYGCGGLSSCNGLIQNNVIAGNSGWDAGGVAHCGGTLLNNTLADNYGYGIDACTSTIRNCIVWGSRGTRGVQVHASSLPAYSCIENWTGGGVGNLAMNPHFVDAANLDYHLRSWSPCIDAGDPTSSFANEPKPNGGRINLGSYGNTAEATTKSADADADELPDDWEQSWFGNLDLDGLDDPDGDLFSNLDEYQFGRDPMSAAEKGVVNLTEHTGYLSIQAALDEAVDGDELMVHPGKYDENIRFAGKNVVLRSSAPEDPDIVANTIIAGGETATTVAFAGTEDETCVLAGFSIMNGHAEIGAGILGGTTDRRARATIRNNLLTSNEASDGGGGMAFCDGLILSNTIAGNWSGAGGGVYGCSGRIYGNSITDNYAARGGGLAECAGTIENNLIASNTVYQGQGGGLAGCTGPIRANTISANRADIGGGLYGCPDRIEGNVICANFAETNGGGLANCTGTIANNTVVGNAAETNGGGFYACTGPIVNCIIWGNSAWDNPALDSSSEPTYCAIQDWPGGGTGNIVFHPHFVASDTGDFHLRSWSPCVDAGDPAFPYALEPEPNGGRINLGAYGNTPEAASKSPDSDTDGLPDDWEMAWFGDLDEDGSSDPDGDFISNATEYLFGANPTSAAEKHVRNTTRHTGHFTIQQAMSEAESSDELIVFPGVYLENVNFGGRNVVLRSSAPSEPDVVVNTVIDGHQRGSAVSFAGTEDETCVLEGFTIRNGSAERGGGICGGTEQQHTRATIRGNIITNCTAAPLGGSGLAFCDGLIFSNQIVRNTAAALSDCDGTVRANSIAQTRDGRYWDFSGIGLMDCDGLVEDNTIELNAGSGLRNCLATVRANRIVSNLYSGLLLCDGVIQQNTITGNSGEVGAGLRECHGAILDNLVAGNSARQTGGGLHGCRGVIQNNTIVGNSAGAGGAGLAGCQATIRNCIVWGNASPDATQLLNCRTPVASCIENWTGGGLGNFADPPQFLDPGAGDYRLQPSSPCIDRGLSHFWFAWPERGADGCCRLVGSSVDLGCYEFGADIDTDGDLLGFADETLVGTLPGHPDTDGDGLRDGLERLRGSHPLEPTSPIVALVPSDRAAIQRALCLAVPGDEVVVESGICRGSIQFCGTDVILRGSNPESPAAVASTILDGEMTNTVVRFSGSESARCKLAGLTIRNGVAWLDGGGIAGNGTRATIEHNTITQNSAHYGAGLYRCDGTIRDNSILGNSASDEGGGLYECSGDILHNFVSGNTAGEGGGGLSECNGLIEGNTISENTGYEGGGGMASCHGIIRRNLIIHNNGDSSTGGAIKYSLGLVQNNLIARNSSRYGGAVSMCWGEFVNNTVVANTGGGLYLCTNRIVNCIVWGNFGGQVQDSALPIHSCIQYWTVGGTGNLALDPQFVNPARDDYRLMPSSPCIDAGDNTVADLGPTDVLGRTRVLFGGHSLAVDVGACEFCRTACLPAPEFGQVTLVWETIAGRRYSVLYSADLVQWDVAQADIEAAGDTVTFWVDDGSRTGSPPNRVPARFYRCIENP